MLLTLYYLAATWLQSWRLNSMRSKISQIQKHNGSILLYKECVEKLDGAEGGVGAAASCSTKAVSTDANSVNDKNQLPCSSSRGTLQVQGIINSKFIPEGKSQVGDILWFTPSKFSISLFPIPVVDISEWISVAGGTMSFPIPLKGTMETTLSETSRVHLLIEADFCAFHVQIYHFHVGEFGVAKAWHAGDVFSLMVETDEDHLTRLATSFMLNSLSVGHGLELIRIQSVEVSGKPCLMLNTDWQTLPESSSRKLGMPRRGMTAAQWHSHVLMLRSFSQAAAKAVRTEDPVSVNGQRGAIVVRGPSPVMLSSPTVNEKRIIESPKDVECESEGICPPSPSVSLSVQRGSNSVEPSSTSASSFGSMSRLSNDTLVAVSPSSRQYGGRSGSVTSLGSLSTASVCSNVQQRVVVPHRKYSSSAKPPNVIIFSESSVSVESVKLALSSTLNGQRYTIYALSLTQMLTTPWLYQASLVVVVGGVPASLTPHLIAYVLQGSGKLLCLCSDLLGTVLPSFRTAEVRPDELVSFSYSTWKHVQMLHHVFCYQLSPSPAKFSQDEQSSVQSGIPNSVEVQGSDQRMHKLDVRVLGAEETWQTPSLLVASSANGGKIVFSQVHLEIDPMQFENDEMKLHALRGSNRARLEILTDILSTHLGLRCGKSPPPPKYTPAYFLGSHELKLELMDRLKSKMEDGNVLKLGELTLKFCGKGVMPPEATDSFLPVLMYACPDTFNTVTYFENLSSKKIGRLAVYAHVMTSSMAIVNGRKLAHGLAVIPCVQTKGSGRGGNAWLSPEGCAMYTVQLHVPLDSVLGQHLSLLQHLVTLATVSAICAVPGLHGLDLGMKWPNDIYVGKSVKLGGAMITSLLHENTAICNAGVGFNLMNKEPTTCLNEMIAELNKKTGSKAPPLSFEKYFAIVFTELERIIDLVQDGHLDEVIALYYKYWLHSNAKVSIMTADGTSKQVTIVGIDDFGFLRVQDQNSVEFTVQPDGNSFDMLSGLIAPKVVVESSP